MKQGARTEYGLSATRRLRSAARRRRPTREGQRDAGSTTRSTQSRSHQRARWAPPADRTGRTSRPIVGCWYRQSAVDYRQVRADCGASGHLARVALRARLTLADLERREERLHDVGRARRGEERPPGEGIKAAFDLLRRVVDADGPHDHRSRRSRSTSCKARRSRRNVGASIGRCGDGPSLPVSLAGRSKPTAMSWARSSVTAWPPGSPGSRRCPWRRFLSPRRARSAAARRMTRRGRARDRAGTRRRARRERCRGRPRQ